LNTIAANMRTEGLLKQSQLLTSELQSQQEELKKTNDRLEQQAAERSRAQAEDDGRRALVAPGCPRRQAQHHGQGDEVDDGVGAGRDEVGRPTSNGGPKRHAAAKE